jgi:hypothetical protein
MFAVLGHSPREPREKQFRLAFRSLIVSLVVFLFLPCCSWIFVKPAKVGNDPNPDCSTSRVAPVLDTVQAVANAVGVVVLASMDDFEHRNTYMVSWSVWAGIYTASAVYGYSNTSECIENMPEGWDKPAPADPDERARVKKKKPPVPLQPEPGVMRSN